MRHFSFFACLLIVVCASFVRAENFDYSFDERDTNSTETTVYQVTLGDKSVNVSVAVGNNKTLQIEFPAIGNFSASYSSAGSDLADYVDPDTAKPEGASYKGASFFITLFYPNGSQVEGFVFPEPIIVTVGVDNVSANDKLYLYDTVEMKWKDAAATCANPMTQVVNGNLQVAICHLTQFAVFETIAKANLSERSHNTAGIIAAVIVIPIVIVGVIIALVAWTLLRKPKKGSSVRKNRDIEMKEPEDIDESDSDEELTPKPTPKEDKNAEADVKLKKAESDTDTSSDSSEKIISKKPQKEDSDTDTDTDSDE